MKKIKYVLVDDDDDDQLFFKIAIKDISLTFDHTYSKSSIEALSLLKDSAVRPDYIFLDLNMPLLNGKDVLQRVKEMEHLKSCKIVIFTGSSSRKEIEELNSLGVNHYLVKPNSIESLISALKSIFGEENPPFLIEP
jgi:CheY-like chemotaxis protein